MSNTANVNFRIDADIKKKAEKLFSELGLSMSAAYNLFLRQSIREERLPFEIALHVPNRETEAAIEEAEMLLSDPNMKGYTVVEALKELKS